MTVLIWAVVVLACLCFIGAFGICCLLSEKQNLEAENKDLTSKVRALQKQLAEACDVMERASQILSQEIPRGE